MFSCQRKDTSNKSLSQDRNKVVITSEELSNEVEIEIESTFERSGGNVISKNNLVSFVEKQTKLKDSFWTDEDDEFWAASNVEFFEEDESSDFFSDSDDFFGEGEDFNNEDNDWKQYISTTKKDWEEYVKDVSDRWNEYIESTKKEWVDYGDDLNSMSKVDFENGTIKIESIVEESEENALNIARDRLEKQIEKIVSENKLTGINPLESQMSYDGEIVEKSNKVKMSKKIANSNKVIQSHYQSKDGKSRVKLSISIPMVPDHLRIRAEKFLPEVKEWSKKYGISVPLIMAIIHTESFFNPMAKSPANAFGLMQIIPKFAGVDAWQYLYGQSKQPTIEFLYKPDNNIMLGSTYFYLLLGKHFKSVQDKTNRKYLAICAFNWGPTNIRGKVIARYRVNEMDSEKLYSLLQNRTPKETGNYLSRVTSRQKLYEEWN